MGNIHPGGAFLAEALGWMGHPLMPTKESVRCDTDLLGLVEVSGPVDSQGLDRHRLVT